MNHNKVLYISQEITPYLPETPLSTLGRNIPQRMQEKGYEVRTFMPKYGCINERRNQLHEVIRLSGINVIIDDTDHPLIIKVATLQPARMQVYFIDSDDYFQHPPIKELELTVSPEENDERMMFFVRGVIETVKKLRWEPALVHCIGWIGALAPIYLKKMYGDDPTFANAKVIYTLREEGFDGTLDECFVEKLRLHHFSDDDLSALGSGAVSRIELEKLAIDFSDAIIQGSDNIPAELLEYAEKSGKPILTYDAIQASEDAYADFYASISEA